MRIKDVYSKSPISFRGRGTAATTIRNLNELANIIDYHTLGVAHLLDVISASTADNGLTSGTGARTVEISGLDAQYRFQTETVILNGQTAVSTTKSFLRVFAAQVLSAGTGGKNAGAIVVYKTGTGGVITAGVPGTLTSAWVRILAEYGIGTSGMYTVPAGVTMEARRLLMSARAQASELFITSYNPLDVDNNSFQNEFSFGMINNGIDIKFPTNNSFRWTEKTDIYFRFLSATAGGIVTADLQIRTIPSFS